MISIGLIIWFIIILFIAIICTPGFIGVLFVSLLIGAAVYILVLYLTGKPKEEYFPEEIQPRIRDQDTRIRDIEEWEKKWNRPHPSRKIKNNRK